MRRRFHPWTQHNTAALLYHRCVKILLLLMVISLAALIPFVVLRKPWAVSLWRRLKTIIVVYAIIIATAGIVRLIMDWESIYG